MEIETKTIKSPKFLEEIIAPKINDVLEKIGKTGLIFLLLSLITALYVKFIPSIDKNIEPLAPEIFYAGKRVSITSILLAVSLVSTTILFLMLIIRHIYELFRNLLSLISVILRGIGNGIINFFQRLLVIFKLKKLASQLGTYISQFGITVYSISSWRESSKSEAKRKQLPINISNFKYVEFEIIVHKSTDNHWRAGVIFDGNNGEEYIFHLYEDHSNKEEILYRIVLRHSGSDTTDARGNLGRLDVKKIHFQVKKINNKLGLFVNGNEVDAFMVPLEKIDSLYVGAWADDRPFDIEFKNIEAVG